MASFPQAKKIQTYHPPQNAYIGGASGSQGTLAMCCLVAHTTCNSTLPAASAFLQNNAGCKNILAIPYWPYATRDGGAQTQPRAQLLCVFGCETRERLKKGVVPTHCSSSSVGSFAGPCPAAASQGWLRGTEPACRPQLFGQPKL